jgi:GAF domain-containing protein
MNITGCFIKIRSPEGPPVEQERLDFGTTTRVRTPLGSKLEILSSYGLSQELLYSAQCSSPQSILGRIPEDTTFVQDLEQESASLTPADHKLLSDHNIRAYLLFPIEVIQEQVAYVALFDEKPGDLTRDDVKYAKAISSRGVQAFLNMQDMDRLLKRQRLYLKSFQEITEAINSTLNINKVLEFAVKMITNVLGIRGTQIRLLDAKTEKLKLAATFGLSDEFLKIGPVYAKRAQEGDSMDKAVLVDSISSDSRIQYKDEILAEGISTILSLPLNVWGKNIGEMTIFSSGDRSFSQEEIDFTNAIAQQCACAIRKAEMYQRVKYEFQQLMEDFGYESSS